MHLLRFGSGNLKPELKQVLETRFFATLEITEFDLQSVKGADLESGLQKFTEDDPPIVFWDVPLDGVPDDIINLCKRKGLRILYPISSEFVLIELRVI